MKIYLTEDQLKNLEQNLADKKPTSGGPYSNKKEELMKMANANSNMAFGEGVSQDQNIAKEKAILKAMDELQNKTGKRNPFYIIKDELFQIGITYHSLVVVELGG
jgi:hypothetical protein